MAGDEAGWARGLLALFLVACDRRVSDRILYDAVLDADIRGEAAKPEALRSRAGDAGDVHPAGAVGAERDWRDGAGGAANDRERGEGDEQLLRRAAATSNRPACPFHRIFDCVAKCGRLCPCAGRRAEHDGRRCLSLWRSIAQVRLVCVCGGDWTGGAGLLERIGDPQCAATGAAIAVA